MKLINYLKGIALFLFVLSTGCKNNLNNGRKDFPRVNVSWVYSIAIDRNPHNTRTSYTRRYIDTVLINGKKIFIKESKEIVQDNKERSLKGIYYKNRRLVDVSVEKIGDEYSILYEIPILSINPIDSIMTFDMSDIFGMDSEPYPMRINNSVDRIIEDTLINNIKYKKLYEVFTKTKPLESEKIDNSNFHIWYLFSEQEGIVAEWQTYPENPDSIIVKSELVEIEYQLN